MMPCITIDAIKVGSYYVFSCASSEPNIFNHVDLFQRITQSWLKGKSHQLYSDRNLNSKRNLLLKRLSWRLLKSTLAISAVSVGC